jgi:hypothetical protein
MGSLGAHISGAVVNVSTEKDALVTVCKCRIVLVADLALPLTMVGFFAVVGVLGEPRYRK